MMHAARSQFGLRNLKKPAGLRDVRKTAVSTLPQGFITNNMLQGLRFRRPNEAAHRQIDEHDSISVSS